MKKKCSYMRVPDAEVWRIPMLAELIKVRDSQLALTNLNSVEVKDLIDHLCRPYIKTKTYFISF